MDDTHFNKQRTSLVLISVAIILYVLGGGHIGDKGSIFGGTIHFDKPEILVHAGIVIYMWLLWWFCIFSKAPLGSFSTNFQWALYSNDTYKETLENISGDLQAAIGNSKYNIEQIIITTQLWSDKRTATLPPLIYRRWWPNKFYMNSSKHGLISIRDEDIRGRTPDLFPKPGINAVLIPAPFGKMMKLVLIVFVKTAFTDRHFIA